MNSNEALLMNSKLTVKEAAALMGVTPQFLRLGLQQGRLPFGVAVKFKRWSYYINPAKFYEYLAGMQSPTQSPTGTEGR